MKLSGKFISHNSGDESILVFMGEAEFSGIIKGNKTVGVIYDCLKLKKETDREKIIKRMKAAFDAPEDVKAADVDKAIYTLRSI